MTVVPVSPANALIVVDVQNDFCPGGSLPVDNGDVIAKRIYEHLLVAEDAYKVIVATKDWHPTPTWEKAYGKFEHFSDKPDYVNTWPRHCVQGTTGAEFHKNLFATAKNGDVWPPQKGMVEFDLIFYKGTATAAYSGFEGRSMPSSNLPDMGWTLDAYLRDKGITHVDVCGLATDYCVKATVLDAVKNGYRTHVLTDLIAGVTPQTSEVAINDMVSAGALLADSVS